MIYTDLSENKVHFIEQNNNKIYPDAIIFLPLRTTEKFSFNGDFTCLFLLYNPPNFFDFKPLVLEYFKNVNKIDVNNYNYKGIYPNLAYVFKGKLDLNNLNKNLF